MNHRNNGHYARFEYVVYDLRNDWAFDQAAQVFGAEALHKYLEPLKRGANKGKLKGAMIKKICTYGGVDPNTRGIARPNDCPMIVVVNQTMRRTDGAYLSDDALSHGRVLLSGSAGTYAVGPGFQEKLFD
jgi:hypothetical protein